MNARAAFSNVYQDEVVNFFQVDEPISSLPVRQTKVRVPNPRSTWVKELESEKYINNFNKLTSLRKGWDGYRGVPVSYICAQFAANMIESLYIKGLPAPQLVPMSDGTLRLEWHMNQYDLEIEVLGPYEVVACRTDLMTDEEQEIEVQTDFTELAQWVSALAEKRMPANMQVEG